MKFTFAQDFQQQVIGAIQEAIYWTKELNKELTNISVVSNKSGQSLDKVYSTIIEKSRELRVSAQDYAEASEIYYQQGLNDAEVARRSEITIKAAKAAETSTEAMSSQLTAIWNTYQMQGAEQERAASVGARLAADTAVNFRDIAEAMQISATAASQMGVSYDSLAAIIATVGDTTQQSASIIGNAYKTIFSRFYNLTSSSEGQVELGRISEQLKELGINILDMEGNLIPLDNIIQSIGQSWDSYSQKQQIAIAETVGGTRQFGQFLALMQNFDKYQKLLSEAKSETGTSLDQQYSASLNSIESAAENAGEAWSVAFSEIFDPDVIKGLYKGLEEVGEQVGNIIDSFGGLSGILAMIGQYLTRHLIQKLQEGAVLVRQIGYNILPDGKNKQVQREVSTMRTAVNQGAAERRSTVINSPTLNDSAKNQELKNIQIDVAAQQQKITLYGKVASQMQQVNKLLNSKNELDRIQGEHLKSQIEMYQEQGNQAQDNLSVLQQEVEQNKKKLALQRQIAEEKAREAKANPGTSLELEYQQNNLNDLQNKKQENDQKLRDNASQRADTASKINEVDNRLSTIQSSTIAGVDRSKEIAKLQEEKAALLEVQSALDKEQAELTQTGKSLDQEIQKRTTYIEKLEMQARAEESAQKQQAKQVAAQAKVGQGLEDIIEILANQDSEYKGSQDQIDDFTKKMESLKNTVKDFDGENAIFDELNNSIQNITADNMTATLQEVVNILNTPGAGDLIPPETNERIRSLIANMETLENTEEGLANTQRQLNSALSGLSMSGSQYAMTLSNMASNIGMVVMNFQNLAFALEDGNIIGAITNFGMLVPTLISVAGALKTVIGVTTSYTAVKKALNALQTEENAQLTAGLIARSLNITITEGMTGADLKAAAAKKGVSIAGLQENAVISANTVVTGVNAAAWWAHPIVAILAVVILGVVAAFALFNRALKEQAEAARESADASKEQVENLKALNAELETNTESVKDNITAWQTAIKTNTDVAESYKEMIDSIEQLNDSLEKAEVSAEVFEKVQKEMRKGITTGDFEGYYEAMAEAQKEVSEKTIEKINENNLDELNATQKELAAGAGETKYIAAAGDKKIQGIIGELSEFGITPGDNSITLSFDFENPEKFKSQYEQLIEVKEKFEQTYTKEELKNITAYNGIVSYIERASGAYEQLQGNAEEAYTQIQNALSEEIKATSQIIENSSFETGRQAMNNLLAQVTELGQKAGLTTEEIYKLLESIAMADPNMANWMALGDKMAEAQRAISANNNWASSPAEYDSQLEALSKQKNYDVGNFNIGEWNNGLSEYQEVQLDYLDKQGVKFEEAGEQTLREYVNGLDKEARSEKANEIIDSYFGGMEAQLKKEQTDLKQEQEKLGLFMDSLRGEDQELFIKINLENVRDVEDLEEKLNALRQVDLVVRVDYQSQLEEANITQENLRPAMEEYAENETLSYDTVGKLLALGPEYKRFIIETEDGYKLTTEAIEKFNTSIAEEKEALSALLTAKTDYTESFKDLAYIAADLSAMPDYLSDIDIENIGSQISTLVQDFYNGKITMDEFFGTGTGTDGLLGQIDLLGQKVSTLSLDQLSEIMPMIQGITQSMYGYIDSVKLAYEAGEIDGGQMVAQLDKVTTAAQDLDDVTLTTLKKQISDTGKDFNDLEKDEEGLIKITEDLTDEQEELVKSYNKVAKSAKNLDKATAKMDIGESILGITSDYYDQLQEVFDEETLEIKPDVELDFTWMDEMTSKVTTALSQLDNETKTQISSLVTGAVTELTRLKAIPEDLAGVVQQVAQYMIDNNVDFATACTKLGIDSSKSAEELTTIHAGVTQAIVQTGNQAVNEGMQATLDTLNQGEEEAAKFSVKISVKEAGIKGTFPVKFNVLGKDFSFNIPKPYLELEGEAGGTLGTILNNAAGDTSNSLPSNPWEDFSGLGGSKDEKDPLTVGDPLDIDDSDGNTDLPDSNGSSGGGGDKFTPEELIENEEEFVERYENITKAIERQQNALDNISKAMESAYGAKKLKMMDAYNAKIQRLAKTQKEYIKEAQRYYKEDKKALLNSNPDIQKIAKFEPGEYGGIQNPETIRHYLEKQAELAANEYNEAVKKYNTAGDTSDLAKQQLDNAKKKYDETIETLNHQNELLSQLEETETTLMEAINQQVEYIKEWLQNKIDQAVYKMEVHIAINDFDIEYLDVLKEAFGEVGIVGGQSFSFINDQLKKMSDNVDKTTEEVDRLFEIANNIKDPANQDYFMSLFGSPEEGILAWKEFIGTGQIPQEILDELNNSRDQLLDYYKDTLDYLDELWQNYIDQITYYLDEFEALTERLESRQNITESLLDTIEASGLDHRWGADTNSSQYKLMETSMKNIAYQARAAKESFEVANTKAQEMKKELDSILGGRQLSELSEDEAFRYNRIKEAYDELQSQANELEETMYSSITEALERAKEYAEVWGQQIAHSWSEDLGGVFDDLSDAMELYDQKQSITDFFLDDYDKIYELKKLSREIEKEMENISDPETLNRYNTLLDEINTKKEDGSKMTQTELDILRAQFELEQAQAAFEDAQNAKNTMRLARDASGNWSYVYSSDSSEAEDKQQAVEDALANIHRMHREAADEMGELWLQTQQELYEYEQTIDWQMYDNDEKYRQMVDTRRNYYKQQMDQYAQYFIYHNEAIGRNQSDTTLGIIGNITDMATANEQYKQNHDKLVEDLRNNFNKWMGDADLTRQEVGGDYDSLEDMVNEKTTEMINENDALGDAIENLAYETGIWLEQSRDYTADWSQQVVDYYENVISKIKEYLELIQAANSEAANDFTGFNAQRDYTASIQNYAQEFINNGGTVDELMKDETYLQMGKELANKIADSELNANDHWVADMDAMTDDGLGYLEQIANNTKPDKDYVKKDEFDESWQAADRGNSGSLLPGVSGTSRPKPTASGGLIKTPQVRSLAEEGPELVLNASDTQNILDTVKTMREAVKLRLAGLNLQIDQQAQSSSSFRDVNKEVQQIDQQVHIDATFPNVSVASEIEEAFNNLVNQAIQYVSAKKK